MSTPSADESAVILTQKLRNKEPFVFTKFGDGDLFWMSGNPVPIAGGEQYRPGIDAELRNAASVLARCKHSYFGDQLTCSSGPYLREEQERFVRQVDGAYDERKVWNYRYLPPPSHWLHFETLLIHRLSPELLEFYRVLKEDPRRKVLVCGPHLLPAAQFLNCYSTILVNQSNAHQKHIANLPISDIVLTACGRASKILIAAESRAYKSKTLIELGSALDPLFVGRTRSEQVESDVAREYFKGLL